MIDFKEKNKNHSSKWKVTDVAERFEEAAATIKRLPPVKVKGYFNVMPDVVRTAMEILQQEKIPLRMGPPSPDAIGRMEETINWIFYLDDETERRLIWLRAERVPWKQICWRLGCGRTKAWHMWVIALLKIVTNLNLK